MPGSGFIMPTSQERTVVSSKGAKGVDDHRISCIRKAIAYQPRLQTDISEACQSSQGTVSGFQSSPDVLQANRGGALQLLITNANVESVTYQLEGRAGSPDLADVSLARCVRPYLHETIEGHSEDRHRFGYPLLVLHLLGMRVAKLVYQRAVQVEYNGTILQFRPNLLRHIIGEEDGGEAATGGLSQQSRQGRLTLIKARPHDDDVGQGLFEFGRGLFLTCRRRSLKGAQGFKEGLAALVSVF